LNRPGPIGGTAIITRFLNRGVAVRRFFRGTIQWDRLEEVAHEIARRYDEPVVRVEFLEADNWLSVPVVVNGEWFVKVISEQNSVVHALITGARNLGAFSAGTEGFFEHVGTPLQMAERELGPPPGITI
jgi:hypothetical protein